MTTLRTLVTRAFRVGGITQIGTDPEADEFAEGFTLLTDVINGLLLQTMGEPILPIYVGTNADITSDISSLTLLVSGDQAPTNSQLLCNLFETTNIYLPLQPANGCKVQVIDLKGNFSTASLVLKGNGVKVENSTSITLSTDSLNTSWFYRADVGNWVKITSLAEEDESPFPAVYDSLITILLAMRLNPQFAVAPDPQTQFTLKDLMKQFKADYRQSVQLDSEEALLRISSSNRNFIRAF